MTLSDASSFFAAMRVWEQQPFHEGDELTPEHLELIRHQSQRIQIRSRAIDLLARGEHSRFVLERKLLQRRFDRDIVRQTLDELAENGTLSDRRFAENWVYSRIRNHPEGRSHLVAGLRQRGISGELADEVIESVLADEQISMIDTARRFAERTMRRKSPTPDQLTAALYKRGFRGETVRSVVAEFTGEAAPDFE